MATNAPGGGIRVELYLNRTLIYVDLRPRIGPVQMCACPSLGLDYIRKNAIRPQNIFTIKYIIDTHQLIGKLFLDGEEWIRLDRVSLFGLSQMGEQVEI